MLYHWYLRYQMWKISKWRRENEKYLYQLIQYRLLLTKVQFPAKLNTAHGEVARMQIDCRRRNSGNSALVFQHLSFQSYNLIHQQEHNTVDWRTFVKNTAKLRRKMIFFYSISLKYTTQARSNKNQMFLGLKYIPA